MKYEFDDFVRNLHEDTVRSVRAATQRVSNARVDTLKEVFEDVDEARKTASAIKNYVLDNLKSLLLKLEENCQSNGVTVHWAYDAKAANKIINKICDRAAKGGAKVVKAKSMATEEIHLNDYLIKHGHTPIETDLGEFVVQLDKDTPSHIVAPIIHKDRVMVSRTFERHKLGKKTEDPEKLAMQAREHLRAQFQTADVGISGVNFAIAETGRLVIVENEGNNRFCTTAPPVHIAVMGLEKLLPTEADLPLFLRLLAGSATGQRTTVYTHFVTGPRNKESDGPLEVHLVLLDNGRTKALAGPYRRILKCIRCGACLNVCPVYRRSSGHAYKSVYSGPMGAVLTPALTGKGSELAKASTLCGQCNEVCPVDIPIPDMLLKLRSEEGADTKFAWKAFAALACKPFVWRILIRTRKLIKFPRAWLEFRDVPVKRVDFRRWWNERP